MGLLLKLFCREYEMVGNDGEFVQNEPMEGKVCDKEALGWIRKWVNRLLLRIVGFVGLWFICQGWRESDLELWNISICGLGVKALKLTGSPLHCRIDTCVW
jgi:hypothetical protein